MTGERRCSSRQHEIVSDHATADVKTRSTDHASSSRLHLARVPNSHRIPCLGSDASRFVSYRASRSCFKLPNITLGVDDMLPVITDVPV